MTATKAKPATFKFHIPNGYEDCETVWIGYSDEFAEPFVAPDDEDVAREICEGVLCGLGGCESLIRMEPWDGLTEITIWRWMNEVDGNGYACARCGEFVFYENESAGPFWTFDWRPVHGPWGEELVDCYREIPCMAEDALRMWEAGHDS